MPITPAQVAKVNTAIFSSAQDIDSWSQQHLSTHFLAWFNSNVANKGPWQKVSLLDTPANRLGYHSFWNNINVLTGSTATPLQFLCLMGIFANECGGDFMPRAELMGIAGFPGLSYLFDSIPPRNKRSYNTLGGNKRAFDCFHSQAFNAAHGAKPLASRAMNTADSRWSGESYPRSDFPTDPSPGATGYILEADFMKFRGRGFIQTTGRANYLLLIDFVKNYKGPNNTLDFFAFQWRNLADDAVADSTSNDDWDRLFKQSDLIIPAKGINLHNQASRNYLALAGDPDEAVLNMGKRISGGDAYARTFRDRMSFLLDLL